MTIDFELQPQKNVAIIFYWDKSPGGLFVILFILSGPVHWLILSVEARMRWAKTQMGNL